MRPIKLTIKGLNSFIEEQTVDFDKLTSRGLFGIFGPTGSGKSTILDGITLALYGDVSRKSSNYINTNCDKLNVSFEFQISTSEVKKYKVVRSFKRNKSGNPVSDKCKVIDITDGLENVLTEGVTNVNTECKKIIGLSLEDFTRTVVLPQGKFSEFLKLEGKPRREMLERLFNLEQYGDNLSVKLSREIKKEKTQNDILSGQLMGYEGISEEKKKEKEEALKENELALNIANKQLKESEKSFKENQELWNWQLEIESYKTKEKQLVSKGEEIELEKKKVKMAEAADKVKPYVLSYRDTLKNISVTEENLSEYKIKLEVLKAEKEKAEERYILARNKKDKELPKLKLEEQKVLDALEDKKALEILIKDINELENRVKELQLEEEKHIKEAKVLEGRVEKGNEKISLTENEVDKLNLDSNFKEKVQEGLLTTKEFNNLTLIVNNTKDKIKVLKEESLVEVNDKETLTCKLNEKVKELLDNEKAYEELIKNCPGDQNDLLRLQTEYSQSKEKWNEFNRYNDEIVKCQEYINKSAKELDGFKAEKESLEKNIEKLKSNMREYEIENLAHSLREALNNGEVCPVCGSIDHHKENIKSIQVQDIDTLEREIKVKEQQLKSLEANITKIEANQESSNNNIKDLRGKIKSLGEEFKKVSVEELERKINEFANKLNKYIANKEELEKSNKILKDKKYDVEGKLKATEAKLLANEKQLIVLEKEYNKSNEDLQNITEKLNILRAETNVDDFITKSNEIVEIEKKKSGLENDLKKYRKLLEDLIKDKDDHQQKVSSLREILVKEKSTLESKNSNKNDKIQQIVSKVGKIDNLEELLNSIISEIKAIESEFELSEKNKDMKDKVFQDCNEKLISLSSTLSELLKRKDIEKIKLDSVLLEQNFETIDDVMNNIIENDVMKVLKEKIEKYNDDLSKIRGAIESVAKKISGRNITEEEWIRLQEEKESKEKEVQGLSEIKIKIEEELKVIENKMLELKDLLKQKAELDHKLALLNDLDKLFKGKKFVEFVAATRLKYVSIEASNRLKEITNGNYGLEVDEDGKFIIRDYKNGGAARDASTLSGGETFLASLALALALSSEIQLKGTAPLELFFLDEGFGTLDDNLLEVVMGSLERIHNDKLKVGIISHVESIKNRIPVKLLITPAESGKGGSKVKIELS